MSIFLALTLGVLIIILLVKLIKVAEDNDIFINCIIPLVVTISAIVDWYQNGFHFKTASEIIYIIDVVVAIVYIGVFFVKYFNNKNK